MKHPAKFSSNILDTMEIAFLRMGCQGPILDPFAGTGRIHQLAERLGVESVGIEIEPEWAEMDPRTLVGNALHLPFKNRSFATGATSPCYGNRMADHHEAKDGSTRHTYRHYLGHPLRADNSGAMQWGPEYRRFHELAWAELRRCIRPAGHLLLNIKDHRRKGKVQDVADWHRHTLNRIGFTTLGVYIVPAEGLRHGANLHGHKPLPELVYVFERR